MFARIAVFAKGGAIGSFRASTDSDKALANASMTGSARATAWCDPVVRRPGAMPMNANDIEKLIKAGIPDAEVTIRDLAGDGDHYAATVIAESFRGKSRVQQHQLVYNALKGQMGGALHALALQTGLPEA